MRKTNKSAFVSIYLDVVTLTVTVHARLLAKTVALLTADH